ncbi:transposase [Streptomyces sp. NPDC005526]|uniref:transposase n=1 Tax=Streptomyces sp. NPDC005526 TaxID=3156885 RepID=UPI0033A52CFD
MADEMAVIGGVDTHTDFHQAAVIDSLGRHLATEAFPTTPDGYRRLLEWLRWHGEVIAVGVEGTGAYGSELARLLRANQVTVIEVDRPDRRARRANGKSDPVDAFAAATAVLSGRASGTPKTRDGIVEAIRALRVVRQLVVSDAHAGLVDAIGAVLPGASWQRCRTHYARNLLSQVPKSAQPWVATLLRTVFEQPDTDAVRAQMRHVLDALEAKFQKAAAHLDTAQHDLLAFAAFPREIWRQIWSNNSQERLNKEIRRRTDVVGIFPDRTAVIRLVGAVLAEQNDEWTEARRYMGLDLVAKARLHPIESETDDTTLPTELTA